MNAFAQYEPRARKVALPMRGGEMAVLDFGPPGRAVDIVFCHANGFNGRTYRSILAPLADELRILAIDMRGHGATTLPAVVDGREGWADYRDDLLALLAAETQGEVVLAGHSMGGTCSLLAAAEAPARVKALALFDPVLMETAHFEGAVADNPMAEGASRRRAVFPSKADAIAAYTGRGAFRTWRPEQLADYVEAGFEETPSGEVALICAPEWEASNFRTHNNDVWAKLRDSRCPIRLLRAESQSTVQLGEHEPELDASRRVRIETVPGATHFLPMERPEVVRRVLRELAR